MKKLSFLAVLAALLTVSCTKNEKTEDAAQTYPLQTFLVQVGSSYYHADIDQFDCTVNIGGIEDLSSITDVEYTLGSDKAFIWPDPKDFVGKWEKSQTVVVTDGNSQTAYEILFTLYEEPTYRPPVTPEEPEENIIFFDDFNKGSTPDTEYWELCVAYNSAWNQHFVDDRDWANEQIKEIDGVSVLELTAQIVDGKYSNAGIRSTFGIGLNTRLEVRARFEKAAGGFPAIWQMPIGGETWPRSGEIDLMEWIQGTPNMLYHTIHTANLDTGSGDRSSSRTTQAGDTNQWKVYGVERTENAVTFYVDGKEIWSYTKNESLEGEQAKLQYPFASYEYDIILNYSFGGYLNGNLTWPGAIKDEEYPAHMYIDWVKVIDLNDPEDAEETEE